MKYGFILFFQKYHKYFKTRQPVVSSLDRTGIAAALLLYSLGVPYNTIVSDYLATGYYRTAENKKTIAAMVQYMHIDENVAMDMLSVKKEYLDASFTTINKQYGSVDNFLQNEIGLDADKIKTLRKKFLD